MSDKVHYLSAATPPGQGEAATKAREDVRYVVATALLLAGVSGLLGLVFGWRAGLAVPCLWMLASGALLVKQAHGKDRAKADAGDA